MLDLDCWLFKRIMMLIVFSDRDLYFMESLVECYLLKPPSIDSSYHLTVFYHKVSEFGCVIKLVNVI